MTGKSTIEEMLSLVQMDPEARQVFLNMPREEQLLAILGIQGYIRQELALVKKTQYDFDRDLHDFKQELRNVRIMRERKEQSMLGDLQGDDELSTTQKIIREVTKAVNSANASRFDGWQWFRDKVLPSLVSFAMLGLLYLLFSSGSPP